MTRDAAIMACVRYAIGGMRARLTREEYGRNYNAIVSAAGLAACRAVDSGLKGMHAKRRTAIAAYGLYLDETRPRNKCHKLDPFADGEEYTLVYPHEPDDGGRNDWVYDILGRMNDTAAAVLVRSFMHEEYRDDIAADMGLTMKRLNVATTTAKQRFKNLTRSARGERWMTYSGK